VMRRNRLLGASLAVVLGVVGCQNETTEPAVPAHGNSMAVAATGTARHLRLNPVALKGSDQLHDRVLGSSEHVIDPEAYKCREATRVGNWFNSQLNRIPQPVLVSLVNDLAAPDVAFVDAYVLEPLGPQEFGYTGEFNTTMPAIATSVQNFWNFTNPVVLLAAMKGTYLTQVNRVTFIYENFFTETDEDGNEIPVSHTEAVALANQLHDVIVNTRSLDGGDHPLFSFNAFAIPQAFTGPKVAMGDGVMEGLASVGLGNIAALANQAVYAHEFGHQIQFKNNYFADAVPGATTQAELTRYTELMADAYSGYYLAHQNLGKTDKQQIRDAERAFFNLGDCAFDNGGHHGTPNQRQAAVDFGMEVGSRPGATLTQQQFHALFVAKYPEIIAPDKK
jgi:hypothetical protein